MALSVGISTHADQPLPPKADYTTYSPTQTCVAQADVIDDEIRFFKRKDSKSDKPHFLEKEAWKVPFWQRYIFIPDRCDFVVIGYGGHNLLALPDKSPRTKVFEVVWSDGRRSAVHLSDIYEDLDIIPRTTSHWNWLERWQWDGTAIKVTTIDGRTISFTPRY